MTQEKNVLHCPGNNLLNCIYIKQTHKKADFDGQPFYVFKITNNGRKR